MVSHVCQKDYTVMLVTFKGWKGHVFVVVLPLFSPHHWFQIDSSCTKPCKKVQLFFALLWWNCWCKVKQLGSHLPTTLCLPLAIHWCKVKHSTCRLHTTLQQPLGNHQCKVIHSSSTCLTMLIIDAKPKVQSPIN
jgi:hypothetical protein